MHLKYIHNCLIIFRSGEFGSQSIMTMLYISITVLNHFHVLITGCDIALSCMKYNSVVLLSNWRASRKSKKCCVRIPIYVSWLTVPSIKTIGPNLSLIKHLYIITEPLSNFHVNWIFFRAYFCILCCCPKIQIVKELLSHLTINSSNETTCCQLHSV